MTMMFIKIIIPVIPKQVVAIFDLGYLGMEKDYPINYHPYRIERRRETKEGYMKKKKSITDFILKRE